MLQYSLTGQEESKSTGRDFTTKIKRLVPNKNGFLDTVMAAYNNHHVLVLRPDDVWLAILCQFNFFVNANAELLRASFVAHEGQPELSIVHVGNRGTLDFALMARQMVELVEKNVSDPTLRAWALPSFTTTTTTDTTVASVLLMATLKAYFKFRFVGTRCGLPRVILEGEKADWVDILTRIEKLKEYGLETVAWYHLLRPIITRFVSAFDAPESEENANFWSKIVHHHVGSGVSYYTGWINAFAVFSPQGKWQGHTLQTDISSPNPPESLGATQFWATYAKGIKAGELVYDDTPYHRLDSKKVPPGYATVDVTLDDNNTIFKCAMVAGSVGMRVSSSGDAELTPEGKGEDDTVRPVAGWWMYTKESEGGE
ncbi:hypothetical protein K438DRAFT_1804979 [Mycena galopus ATCC 62051]|nr:hypothetical protein K438DRAFT_1804979 [Mycena galopus ATCC 62051]